MPPRDASAPGSIGKNRPWSRRCRLSALRVTPGSTTQSRSSAWTANTRFMAEVSIEIPPCGALMWPSNEVPVPNGIIGTPCRAHSFTMSTTSAVVWGNTTASGGSLRTEVRVLACCSRIEAPWASLSPKRWDKASITAWIAASGRRVAGASGPVRPLSKAFMVYVPGGVCWPGRSRSRSRTQLTAIAPFSGAPK